MRHLPKTRSEVLSSGVSKKQLEEDYCRVTRGVYLHKLALPPGGVGELSVEMRALASQLRFPSAIIGGWAAARLWGVGYFGDGAPVNLHSRSRSLECDGALRQRHHFQVRPLRFRTERVRFVSVEQALVDCLVDIRDGAHSWWVPPVEGLTVKQVLSVQVIDAFRNALQVSRTRLDSAAHHRFDRDALAMLWRLSCPHAQSPWETLLRMALSETADWMPQHPFYDENGYRYTVADFASHRHRVAAFYDGGRHNQPKQIAHDKLVDQKLLEAGWFPVRVTKEQLRDLAAFRRRLVNILISRPS